MTAGLTPEERQRQYLDRMERARRLQEWEEREEDYLLPPGALSERETRIARGLGIWTIALLATAGALFLWFAWAELLQMLRSIGGR